MTAQARGDRATATAVVLVLCGVACFTGIDSSARWLAREAHLPAYEIAFIRYFGHLLIVLVVALPVSGARLWQTRKPTDEVLRGLFLLGSTLFNFIAVRHLPLSLTSALLFTSPILVCALSMPVLGERVGPRRWAAIVIGMFGVVLITRPWSADVHWAMGASLIAALFAALYLLWTRRLAGVDPTSTQQFYAALTATLVLAPLALSGWIWPASIIDWIPFILIGAFGWLGHQLMTTAHGLAPASSLSPFFYIQIVFMIGSDLAIYGLLPDLEIFPGVFLVILTGLFIWVRENRSQTVGVKQARQKP